MVLVRAGEMHSSSWLKNGIYTDFFRNDFQLNRNGFQEHHPLVANYLYNFPTISINHKISTQVTENGKHTLASGKLLLLPSPFFTLDFANLHLSLAFLAEAIVFASNPVAELRTYKVKS